MKIGARLRRYRSLKGWNQRELARESGVDHSWIARLESGERNNISLAKARALAVALGISLDILADMPGARAHQRETEAKGDTTDSDDDDDEEAA